MIGAEKALYHAACSAKNGIADTLYSKAQNRLSNCPCTNKKRRGAVANQGHRAPFCFCGLFFVG